MDTDFKVKKGLKVANNLLTANSVSGKIGIYTDTPTVSLDLNTQDAIKLPAGPTASRPSTGDGAIRYNTDLAAFEGYANSSWMVIAQSGSNSSVFSSLLTPKINFENTGNNSLSYSTNTISLNLANTNIITVNTSLTTFNTNLKIANSTANITLIPPTSAQVSSGNYYWNANGSYVQVSFNPSGSNTQIQFNNSGNFGSSNGLTFNNTTNTLSVANTIIATNISANTFTGSLSGNANTVSTITSNQVSSALGFTPANANGNGASGTWGISITGNANTVTNGVYTNGSYSNPTWLTSVPGSIVSGNITGSASNITSYTINQNLGTSNSPSFLSISANTFAGAIATGNGASGTWGVDISGSAAKLAGVAPTTFGLARLGDASAAAARSALNLGTLATADAVATIHYVIDGGGSAIVAGVKGDLIVPYGCTVLEWSLLADQAGSAVIDVWKASIANFPPVVANSIAGSAKPTLSAAAKATSATLTGWTTAISAGDILRFNVDSAATVTRLTLALKIART